MSERTGAPWLVVALGALCAGAIAAAILVVGPASGSQPAPTRTATAARGVVQSTVSGAGNLQAASQLDLGFQTGGTVTGIYVKQGQHVTQGQLLATLDPQSAEVTLEQAKASLQSAEAALAEEEEASATSTSNAQSASPKRSQGATPLSGGSSSSSSTHVSAATREANLASARAAVRSGELSVRGDEQAVEDTRLYAPESGTIVSLSGQVGEVVSATGTTRASSTGSSSSGTGATSAGGGARVGTAAGASGSTSSSSSGSASSALAVLSDLSSMRLVVALSESEIGEVHDGQIATVTVEALEGRKLAAHVREVALTPTDSSGAGSYDVTFQLDQLDRGLKLGMSATAEVVVKQAQGLSVPTSAIAAGTVTVLQDGNDVRRRVVTGMAGDSSTIVLSGLRAGETVVLPSATGSSSATSLLSRLGSRVGGGLGGGGLGGGLGGGAFPRGGG